mmetsp:Transcript_4714/g.12925  ORF Transcript_4714/g.12925 Transcript_4714/m.12925 type:complete len:302 (-) Transcript_4714:348-1253(-)
MRPELVAGIRQPAPDDPDTVLVSCNGREARFKLPNPLLGSNGEGAMVYFQGHWMTPPRFEKLCNMKGKAWRRSLRVYTRCQGNEMGWLQMDKWLKRLCLEHGGNNNGLNGTQGGVKDRSDSSQEGSGDTTSFSDKIVETSDAETSSHRSGGQAKEATHNQPAGSRQPQKVPQQAAKGGVVEADKPASDGPSSFGEEAAAALGATDKHPKQGPPTSPKAAGQATTEPPYAKPARGGPAAQVTRARAGAANTSPSSITAAHAAQMNSGRGGKSVKGGMSIRRAQAGSDAGTPSNNLHNHVRCV